MRTISLFQRTVLKEIQQNYILQFIYNHIEYKDLIFTGGTALRKLYGLSRLSEDVDFDFVNDFDIYKFSNQLKTYFVENLQNKFVDTKVAKNERTVFMKFPDQLFVRCDFASIEGIYGTNIMPISTPDATFFVKAFDFPTLFANKIIALLQRQFFKGRDQKEPFKGRDIFDLMWLLERYQRNGLKDGPNWERIYEALNVDTKDQVVKMLQQKLDRVDPKDVKTDLEPFVESPTLLDQFTDNFKEIIKSGLNHF